jgi:phosphatidylglycerophosphate synthase
MAELGSRATIKVSFIGKAKTTAQLISLILMIYHQPLFGLPVYEIGLGLYYLAAFLTLYSMILYLKAAWPVMSSHS